MLTRFPAFAALIFCTSAAFAQEMATPAADATGQPAPRSVIAPASETPAATATDMEKKPAATPGGGDQGGSFLVPGGMGYAPLNFTPGQGKFDRKPLSFSTNVQMGYDDNINASSGHANQMPIKSSMLTTASEGVELLLSQSRMGLSLSGNGGGQYYWNRDSNKFTPTGSLNLVFGYKLTPRAQFSALFNGLYTTQPTQSVVNGLVQSHGRGYFVENNKFDLLYAWTPRFSTDSFYSINGVYQQSQELKTASYTNQTVGESLRYTVSQLVTGVLEGRYSELAYNNSGLTAATASRDSNTYFVLTGCDMTLSRRFSGSFRGGLTTRNFEASGESATSSPYLESTLNYLLTKFTTVNWDLRYGYDDGTSNAPKSKSTRTGLSLFQLFTPKLRGSLGVNYIHIDPSESTGINSYKQDAIDTTLGATYSVSQSLSLFANATNTRRITQDVIQEFSKNVYYLGVTYQY